MNKTKAGLTSRQIIQIITIAGLVLSIIGLYYVKTNAAYFAVGGGFQQLLADLGFWGPVCFILIQIVQVIYPVIPGGLTCIVGHVLFGPLYGFIYNFTGIFTGSVLAFLLARRYGEIFVRSFVSQATYDKYIGYLDRGKFFERFLAAAFILPGFPDDFLCMVAGMSKMSLKKFAWITLIAKPATLYLYTVIGYQGLQAVYQFLS